jgi:hypothetical protein
MDRAANIAALIVVLAMVAVIFKSKQTQGIIKNFGNLFEGAIAAAERG